MNETPTRAADFDAMVARAAETASLPPPQVAILAEGALSLLEKHARPDLMRPIYAAIAGAETRALAAREAKPPRGGLLGGLMRNAGGLSGAAIADAMALSDRCARAGMDRDALKRALPALRDVVRQETGRDLLGEALRSVPGVGALLGSDGSIPPDPARPRS